MNWIIAGLGNPTDEYTGTRHNVGRDLVLAISKKEGVGNWKEDKKLNCQSAKGELFGKKVTVLLPNTYMNNSGASFKTLVVSKKQAEQLVVVQDELDLPLGAVKISFGSGSGGHQGINSIQKVLKTKDFVRIRVGISPTTASGKTKKPDSERVVDFVLGKFRPPEVEKLKKIRTTVCDALELLVTKGRASAMTEINSR